MRRDARNRRVGLARALSKLGYCSRSRAVDLIRSGRVSLNQTTTHDPEAPVSGRLRQIAVDGKLIEAQRKIYLMLNKPSGVVTTASDEKGRETVYTMLYGKSSPRACSSETTEPWVAPIGRLDKASEGLLLLTNDSEWGARVAAPDAHLDKTYHVQVAIVAENELLQSLLRGVKTKKKGKGKDEGVLRVKRARRLRSGQKNCWLEIVLDEGRNRHIRRMMEAMGIEVLRLVRVAIGPLQLGDLAKGQRRALTVDEKRKLDRALQNKTPS